MLNGIGEGMLQASIFTLLGAVLGIFGLLFAAAYIPGILSRFTPNIDEEEEIAKGNASVADYFGKVVGATIIGVSLIISAAIIAGIHA